LLKPCELNRIVIVETPRPIDRYRPALGTPSLGRMGSLSVSDAAPATGNAARSFAGQFLSIALDLIRCVGIGAQPSNKSVGCELSER
jgi:hypothetical protein